MSQPEDIEFSYTKKGFVYHFSATFDFLLNDWRIIFLVYHTNSKQIYLSEYSRFRKQVLRKLEAMDDLIHKSKIIDELDYKYVNVISSYLHAYTLRIRKNKPEDSSLFDYGRQAIERLMGLITTLKIDDLTVTKLDQKNNVTFYFVWNRIITGTYTLNKLTDQDKFSSEY